MLTIPIFIKGIVIRGIKDKKKGVFENKNIHGVKMHWNITYIGANAFRNNPIQELDLSNLTFLQYIGSNAFYRDKGLKNCALPFVVERDGYQYVNIWSDSDSNILHMRGTWDFRKTFRAKTIPLD